MQIICPGFEVSVSEIQYNGTKWNFACGAHSNERLHLKYSTVTSFSGVSVPIILDNPKTSQFIVFIGTISSVGSSSSENCQQ